MIIEKCLNASVKAGKLTAAQAKEVLDRIKEMQAANGAHGMNAAEAGLAVAQDMGRKAAKEQQQAALSVIRQAELLELTGGDYNKTLGVFVRDPKAKARYSNVEARQRQIRGQAHSLFLTGLDAYRTKTAGLTQDVPGLIAFVRQLYKENTGDGIAAAAAKAWNEMAETLRLRGDRAGMDIPGKEGWRLPQRWDDRLVKAQGRQAFEDYMQKALADGRLRITDFETGRAMTPDKAGKIIREAYDRIESNGLSDLTPGAHGGTKVADRHASPRVFEWTSADAWLDFNRTYGTGDAGIFELLNHHIDGMARDIGLVEILGPNPHHTAGVLVDTARKNGASGWQAYRLEAAYDHVSGRARSPVSQGIARFGGSVRAWLSSAQLGSATLSSVTDFQFLRQTASWNGLDASKVMAEYVRLLDPTNAAHRKTAVRLGLIAEEWSRIASGAQRHGVEDIASGFAGKSADFVMRTSGLSGHTQAGRWAFGMEYLGDLADQSGRSFDRLKGRTLRAFDRYGIDAADWDAIRKGVADFDGVKFIHPEKLAKEGHEAAANKVMEMILTEMDYAIPTPGAFERSLLLGKTRPGTWAGEFLRGSLQYKSFPVTIMTTHLMRMLYEAHGVEKGLYLANTVIGVTVMGALAWQLKQVAKGKDPQDMWDGKFWLAAFSQGGGAGILGDFLFAATNRANKSFWMTMVGGPTGGLVDDIVQLTGGNVAALIDGKDTNFGRDLAQFMRHYTPGTSLWQTRLATDRLIWDQLQMMVDPKYFQSFSRIERSARRDYGQEFFWGPGQATPARGPDLEAAFQ